jgi:ABC-type polysaccharide/polyol phosphate export permease
VSAYHDILYWGRWPNWRNLALVTLGSVVVLVMSHAIFKSYRDGFAEEI